MTCLIAPYSYFFKPMVINLRCDTLVMQVVLDTEAYQDLEAKLDRLKRHRIK